MNTLFDLSLTTDIPLQTVVSAFLLSFILGMVVAIVYRHTNRGFSYESSFAFTLVMIAVIVTAIMITIGSNIALSLGLIGSLSIIRFRTAIKNSIDMAFLFWAIAIGLAAGAQNYPVAFITTIFMGGIVYFLGKWGGVFNVNTDYILVVQAGSKGSQDEVTRLMDEKNLSWKLKSSFVNKDGSEYTYSIYSRRNVEIDTIISQMNKLKSVEGVTLLSPETNLYI